MSNPLDTCPTCGSSERYKLKCNNPWHTPPTPEQYIAIHSQILETGMPDTWKYLGDLKWFHNKCGQSHLMGDPCFLAPVQAKPKDIAEAKKNLDLGPSAYPTTYMEAPAQPPTGELDNDLEGIIAQHNMDALNRNVPADTISVSHAAVKILLLNAKEAGKREGAIAELKLIPHWRDGVFINDGMAKDSYYFKRLAELNEQENNHV